MDGGGGDTGIKGTGEEGAGVRKFWGRVLYENLLNLYEVSNRRIEVNSGILTMNPALTSLHRQGVFR